MRGNDTGVIKGNYETIGKVPIVIREMNVTGNISEVRLNQILT